MVDTPQRPSPIGRGLRRFREGLQRLPWDGGHELLEAVNDLWGHELQGLVGQHGHDGSVIVAAAFAAPVPHSSRPQTAMLTVKLSTRRRSPRTGAVETGTQYLPLMDDHGQMLAHPEDSSRALVRNFDLGRLFHQFGALETLYRAVNADPHLRDKLLRGFVQGHEDEAARMLDWRHVLGGDPARWLPRQSLREAADDAPPADGGLQGPGPVRVRSPEEARKLPSGTLFRTPDGRTIRRH